MKYLIVFIKPSCIAFVVTLLAGRFLGFESFMISPLSWEDLFTDYKNFLIIFPVSFGALRVYALWNDNNKPSSRTSL